MINYFIFIQQSISCSLLNELPTTDWSPIIKISPSFFVFIPLSFLLFSSLLFLSFLFFFLRGIIVPPFSPPAALRPLRLQTPYHLTSELINMEHVGVQVALTRGALGRTRWEDTSHCNPFAFVKTLRALESKIHGEPFSPILCAHRNQPFTFVFCIREIHLWNLGEEGEERRLKARLCAINRFFFPFFLVGSLFRRSEKNFFLLRILILFKWISFGGKKWTSGNLWREGKRL